MRESRKKVIVVMTIAIAVLIVLLANMTVGQPLGANTSKGASSRGSNSSVSSQQAQAGNVTQLDIDQTRITDIWQGFFGNVSGEIVLENAAGNSFYDWTLTDLTGEVYATRREIIDWTDINCTNQTEIQSEEARLNIASVATDGINETYSQTGHPSFFVGSTPISGCPSTQPYNSSGTSGSFWNILLSNNATNVVYTSLLNESQNAFDNTTVDFEILVPVNRTTGFATYYFYAELS